jgi:hypothetical protein
VLLVLKVMVLLLVSPVGLFCTTIAPRMVELLPKVTWLGVSM